MKINFLKYLKILLVISIPVLSLQVIFSEEIDDHAGVYHYERDLESLVENYTENQQGIIELLEIVADPRQPITDLELWRGNGELYIRQQISINDIKVDSSELDYLLGMDIDDLDAMVNVYPNLVSFADLKIENLAFDSVTISYTGKAGHHKLAGFLRLMGTNKESINEIITRLQQVNCWKISKNRFGQAEIGFGGNSIEYFVYAKNNGRVLIGDQVRGILDEDLIWAFRLSDFAKSGLYCGGLMYRPN